MDRAVLGKARLVFLTKACGNRVTSCFPTLLLTLGLGVSLSSRGGVMAASNLQYRLELRCVDVPFVFARVADLQEPAGARVVERLVRMFGGARRNTGHVDLVIVVFLSAYATYHPCNVTAMFLSVSGCPHSLVVAEVAAPDLRRWCHVEVLLYFLKSQSPCWQARRRRNSLRAVLLEWNMFLRSEVEGADPTALCLHPSYVQSSWKE